MQSIMITRACRQQSQSEGINHVKQTPTNPNANQAQKNLTTTRSRKKPHATPMADAVTINPRKRHDCKQMMSRMQKEHHQTVNGRHQRAIKSKKTGGQTSLPHLTESIESIDPNYFRYFSKYFGSNQPTRSNAVHSLLALLTSILQACWASVLRNSLPMASARTRASKMRRLLHR